MKKKKRRMNGSLASSRYRRRMRKQGRDDGEGSVGVAEGMAKGIYGI